MTMRPDYLEAAIKAVKAGLSIGNERAAIVAFLDVCIELRRAREAEERLTRERDEAVACNEEMRAPTKALRELLDMPASGEASVLAHAHNTIRVLQRERDEAQRALEAALAHCDAALSEREALKAEVERLRALHTDEKPLVSLLVTPATILDIGTPEFQGSLVAVEIVRAAQTLQERDALRAWVERARAEIDRVVRTLDDDAAREGETAFVDTDALRALLADCPVTAPEGKP